eukprot:CAMPEP_0206588052 /NCGR_PEP_ID=MMETSP0325_2-20121206/38033_1 /ASSEMBLY_ACC=CAM_ASM_000347 /TAXON_ID=2866 /ORGANISM="Crypthecodinium cohnii, Strain Seligo" /LENGTH=58 /DNA_ID=CAMNT_0054096217 /DNA_START=163 /DNA_END=336 /DNA_ORIENTATION=-
MTVVAATTTTAPILAPLLAAVSRVCQSDRQWQRQRASLAAAVIANLHRQLHLLCSVGA